MTWDDRVLCPNEACIGVLGSDGRCPQCGATGDISRVAAATQARAGARNDGADDSPADDDDDDDADSDSDGDTDSHDADAADPPSAANAVPIIDAYRLEPTDWSVRELCSDGGCIGVVHGGVCNACGRRSDG